MIPTPNVISVNIRRRHLNLEERERLLIELIARSPEKSDRQIAKDIGVSHHTVGKARAKGEDVGRIAHVAKRTDTKGRQQPASKPPRPSPHKFKKSGPEGEFKKGGEPKNWIVDAPNRTVIEVPKPAETSTAPKDKARSDKEADLKYAISHRLPLIDDDGKRKVAMYFIAHLVDSYKPEDRRNVIADLREILDDKQELVDEWDGKRETARGRKGAA